MRRSLITVACALAGCGDPIAAPEYRGEPLFVAEGRILSLPAPIPGEEPLNRASVLWSTGAGPTAPLSLVEQPAVSAELELPDRVVVRFFEPPERRHLQSIDPPFAVGALIVYRDLDRDQRYGPGAPDVLVAATLERGFVYTARDLDAASSPSGRALAAGFSLLDLPTRCVAPRSSPSDDGEPELPPIRSECGAGCPAGARCDPASALCVPEEPVALGVSIEPDLGVLGCRPP